VSLCRCPLYQMTTHHFKTTCQCPLYQTLHISYTNMSKLRPYYTNVHHINHCTLSMPVSTISKLHFSYAKQQKLHPYYKCPSYQMTALFLYKHVKIVNTTLLLGRCPLYISYTHVKIASISKCPLYQSLCFSYAISPKLRTLHFYYTFLMKVHPKSSKLHFPYVLSDFPNESLPKITKIATLSSAHMVPLHMYLISMAIGL
jgi:hypothetical protein